jgi:hypothetical protein
MLLIEMHWEARRLLLVKKQKAMKGGEREFFRKLMDEWINWDVINQIRTRAIQARLLIRTTFPYSVIHGEATHKIWRYYKVVSPSQR